MRRCFVSLALCFMAQSAIAETAPLPLPILPPTPAACRSGAQPMARVDLYFGAGRSPHAAGWRRFLADVVTPRFPDGLTVVEGSGQWRGAHGLEREASRVMTILYRADPGSDGKIETIRSLYKARFRQQSVLRVDTVACVSF